MVTYALSLLKIYKNMHFNKIERLTGIYIKEKI